MIQWSSGFRNFHCGKLHIRKFCRENCSPWKFFATGKFSAGNFAAEILRGGNFRKELGRASCDAIEFETYRTQ